MQLMGYIISVGIGYATPEHYPSRYQTENVMMMHGQPSYWTGDWQEDF